MRTEVIPALGHDHIVNMVAATCVANGSVTTTCSRCDYEDVEALTMLGHIWGEWAVTTPPTATTAGVDTRACTRSGCDETQTREVPATGNNNNVIPGGDTGASAPPAAPPATPPAVTQPDTEAIENDDVPLAAYDNPFEDVVEGAWYFDYVISVYEKGLMTGTSADGRIFSPNLSLTRGMMVTILYRMAGEPDVNAELRMQNAEFSDVVSGLWYSDAVAWAAANNIVRGFGDGSFRPNENITREQMAVILSNYAKAMGLELPSVRSGAFNDEAQISDWAFEAVRLMFEAGVINGKPGDIFDPQGTATRAEVAAILTRFLDLFNEDEPEI